MKHLRQYIRQILLEKNLASDILSKTGKWIDTAIWGDEEFDIRSHSDFLEEID